MTKEFLHSRKPCWCTEKGGGTGHSTAWSTAGRSAGRPPSGSDRDSVTCDKSLGIGDLQGVDFYFSSKSHALKFVDFLQTVVPVRFRHDKQLVSHNEQNSTYNYKYTFSVEIVPICKVGNLDLILH